MQPARKTRRYTLHTIAVVEVLDQGDSTWSAADVADRCELAVGTVYTILQRLFNLGLVARIETGYDGEAIGQTRVWYELSESGKRLHADIRKHVVDPVGMLKTLIIVEDDVDA